MVLADHITSVPERKSEQRFILESVDWDEYERLRIAMEGQHIFMTYDRGRLELMSPSWRHERTSRILGMLVGILAEELEVPLLGGGSTTFRRRDLERGIEADECFYIRNCQRVADKDEIDLSFDPPPDLVIETEVSRRLGTRIEIYRNLGIPEIWRCDGNSVQFMVMQPSGDYAESAASLSFPKMPREQIERFVRMAQSMNETAWSRIVRKWVKENVV